MKKRLLLLCCLMTVALAVCALFAVGCGPTEEEVPEITETVRYSEKTNPYAELTWQEYKDIDDWGKKQKEAPIYYQFEGSYSEAYQGNYSRTFLYMNCYEDGSLHATFGNENYYGFWTNVDRRGRTNVVLHIVRYNDREYNGGVYESVCEAMTHEYYEYSSTIIWDSFGTRTVLISGGHYSPVKSLTVSGGQTKAMVGDDFSTDGLKVTVTREDGKSTDIDEQSFPQNDCRVKFSGYDSTTEGNHEITVTYINTDVTATYNCEVFGLGGISVDASEAKTTYYIGDTLDTKGLAIKADRNDGEKVSLAAKRCKFEGFDTSKAAESLAVKIKFADFETTYNIKVVEPTSRATRTMPEEAAKSRLRLSAIRTAKSRSTARRQSSITRRERLANRLCTIFRDPQTTRRLRTRNGKDCTSSTYATRRLLRFRWQWSIRSPTIHSPIARRTSPCPA